MSHSQPLTKINYKTRNEAASGGRAGQYGKVTLAWQCLLHAALQTPILLYIPHGMAFACLLVVFVFSVHDIVCAVRKFVYI